MLPQNKKEPSIYTHNNPEESSDNFAEWTKPILKGHMLYESIYVTFLKTQNYPNRDQTSGCQVLRNRQGQEGSGSGQEVQHGGLLVVTEIFCTLIVLMSIFWVWYWTRVLQYITTWRDWVKWCTGSVCIISDNCMWIYNYLQNQKCKEEDSSLGLANSPEFSDPWYRTLA